MEKITIGSVTVAKGEKKQGFLEVANRPDGTMISIPVMVANGEEDGPTLLVNACAHGDEHEGSMSVITLFQKLDPKKMKGTVIGVPVLHVDAAHGMRRGNFYDIYINDMNRIHPGNPDGFITERISNIFFEEIVKKADYVMDLHSGANILYLAEQVYFKDSENEDLAKAVGGPWNVIWQEEAGEVFGLGTSTAACSRLGIPAIVLEVGGTGGRYHFLEENIKKMVEGVTNVMRYLKIIDGKHEKADNYIDINMVHLRCSHGGLAVPEESFALRKWVEEGEKLIKIIDFFGNTVEEIKAPVKGYTVGRRVFPLIHPGEWVVFLGKPV